MRVKMVVQNDPGANEDRQWLQRISSRTYREQESVLEVGELFVALLAAVQPVVLVDNLLVAVARRTGHVQTRLLADVDQRRHTAEVVGLRVQMRGRVSHAVVKQNLHIIIN